MRRILNVLLIALFLLMSFLPRTSGRAADTGSVLGGGICLNEVLPDPTDSPGFDTDGNGTPANGDEFVELYNLSSSSIDISGWELWDEGMDNWFTFPGNADDGTTVLPSGAFAVVVRGVQTNGSLPTMTNPDSLAFDNGYLSGVLNNGADNVTLYDPGEDEYVQLIYNGDIADNPPVDYSADGFSSTASRVGQVEDWGDDAPGKAITRYPSGDTNVIRHDKITGADDASPTALTIIKLKASSSPVSPFLFLAALLAFLSLCGCVTLFWSRRRN
ncbi:MAG: hypothetical protein MAG431_00349 [Chloroflexi bacterium]|nr:hypothetical protein [Chloroflexota bacterium]